MATFVAKNSGGVKKRPMIILKEFFFFVLVQQAAPATGKHARIHTGITEQPSFFIKLSFTILELENNPKIH